MNATCIECKSPFDYEPFRSPLGKLIERHVCDECRRGRKNFLNKKWKKTVRAAVRDRQPGEGRAAPNEYESRVKIARELGVDPSTVEMDERRALSKIRSSPELREAFAQYAEAGMPRVKELVGSFSESGDAVLLEYQMQVADFWMVYDRLLAEARAADAADGEISEMPLWKQREADKARQSIIAELRGILTEIAKFQKMLAAKLNNNEQRGSANSGDRGPAAPG